MPASSDIYGQIQQPQATNMLAQLAQAMQVKGLQGQNELAQYTIGKARRGDEETNALAAALKGGLDLSTADGQRQAYGVAPTVAPSYIKTNTEARTAEANLRKAGMEATTKAVELHRQALPDNPQAAAAWVQAAYGNPDLKPLTASLPVDQAVARIPTDPQGFQNWRNQMALGMTKYVELNKPNVQVRNTGGSTDVLSVPGLGGPAQVVSSVKNTVSPDAQLQANTSTENNKRTISAENMRAGVSADGTPVDGGGLLSPESVINAATRYNMDGTLPPNLGRGTQGPRQTAQILNEAARQAAARGDTPEAQRIAQVANKASAQALGTIEKQATMVGAFEKNFNKNADLALELSQKVDRTGAPILNKWINAGRRSVTGDADLAAFDANLKATVNEYAKIVGGGTGSGATAQGEIAKVESLLSAAQTPQQLASVITTMKRETANRMTAFEEQKTELRNSMIRPGSAKPVTPAPGATSAPAGIDPAAIAAELKRRGVN